MSLVCKCFTRNILTKHARYIIRPITANTSSNDSTSNIFNQVDIHEKIKKELKSNIGRLEQCAHYYFNNDGKLFRPSTIILTSKAFNIHYNRKSDVLESQWRMAMIAEMIHTSSLFHDDVIDEAKLRRGRPSVNVKFSTRECVFAGDFIGAQASYLLAGLQSPRAVEFYSKIINDLVQGELMQVYSETDVNEQLNHYLLKSFRKAASLLAYTCKSVAMFAGADEENMESAFQYGRNLGIAFQLVDDALDVTSSSQVLGKKSGNDLLLGLATAPVLLAAQKYPVLQDAIKSKFKGYDINQVLDYIKKGKGVEETFDLARQFAGDACQSIAHLKPSEEKQSMIDLTKFVVDRKM